MKGLEGSLGFNMNNYDKEIREQVAQGATELEILGSWLRAYDRDEIDFEELMEKVSAYNAIFGTGYDVSALEEEAEDSNSEEEQAAKLFGMEEKEKENKEEPTMEDEEL